VSNLLGRIRFVIRKLKASPSQRKAFKLQRETAEMILDVVTRWNSTFYMLERLIKQKKAFNNWLETNPKIGKIHLGYLKLSTADWSLIDRKVEHLNVFEEATKLLSGDKYVTLSMVMPTFIELFTYIENAMNNDDVLNRIKEVLTKAHQVSSKYYEFSDDSIFYLSVVVLDLRFKV
jgi:zinc finger BED domain-containing protein 1 (E3 SUMO-protein ligase ZBED1)